MTNTTTTRPMNPSLTPKTAALPSSLSDEGSTAAVGVVEGVMVLVVVVVFTG